ncbi:unnamed protein product [Laminaria digitata]
MRHRGIFSAESAAWSLSGGCANSPLRITRKITHPTPSDKISTRADFADNRASAHAEGDACVDIRSRRDSVRKPPISLCLPPFLWRESARTFVPGVGVFSCSSAETLF